MRINRIKQFVYFVILLCGAAAAQNTQTLGPGDTVVVWTAVLQPVAGIVSTAVAIPPNAAGAANAISVEVNFSGAPGTFEIDVQDADTDVAGAYISIPGAIINAVNSSNFSRFELSPFRARFARLIVKTQSSNAVSVTARVSR